MTLTQTPTLTLTVTIPIDTTFGSGVSKCQWGILGYVIVYLNPSVSPYTLL